MKKLLSASLLLLLLTACQGSQPNTPATPQSESLSPAAEINSADALKDKIVVDSPQVNEKVQSPLKVTGQARGTWFFEASFPVTLVDEQGKVIAQGPATSSEPWMTEEFIPFEATLQFETSALKGELVLQKDNPSDLHELDQELRLPVTF